MKKLDELIDDDAKGWALVEEWIDGAKNDVEILESEIDESEEALVQIQVSTESPMGAIVYETGGILVDNGWIRLFGGGCEQLTRSLPAWNIGRSMSHFGELPPFLIVADDVLGGIYAINCKGLGDDYGHMYYFAPDFLEWEPMEMEYAEFVWWAFNGDLNEYYADYRWKGWEKDVKELTGDQVFSFTPPLSSGTTPVYKRKRKIITAGESYRMLIGETGVTSC